MGQNKKILLVEDEESLRYLYNRQLTRAQLDVDSAETGKRGMELYRANTYDLVLLDIMLPDTNGIDILRQFKTENILHKSPIILLTNLAEDSVIQKGHELGIVGIIIKAQYTPDQVVSQVKSYLNKSTV